MGRIRDAAAALTGVKAVPTRGPAPDLYGLHSIPGRRISNARADRHTEAYGGQEPIDYVMEAVDLYARTASHAAYYFSRDGERLVENPRAPDYKGQGYSKADPGLVELFKYPNRNSDYTELLELSIIDLLLAGEFFWLKNANNALGQPEELYRVAPTLIDVIPGATSPLRYEYRVPGGETQKWAPEDVVHVKLPNPHDPWRGLGVIAGCPALYDISLSLDESIRQYYEQGTRLSGVLQTDRSIPLPTYEKLKREFLNLYTGRSNQYKVAFLERGLKWVGISGNAEQAQFTASQDKVRNRIYAAFGQSSVLHGEVGGSTDRQAVREAQRIWDNKILRPFLDSLEARVSRQLTQQGWGVDWCIEYEYVMPIEDKLLLAQGLANLPVRVRELRGVIDLPPLGDARDDVLMVDPSAPDPAAKPDGPSPSGDAPYPAGAGGHGEKPGDPAQASKSLESFIEEALRGTT